MGGKATREGAVPSHPSAISPLQCLETCVVFTDLWLNQFLDSTLIDLRAVPERR